MEHNTLSNLLQQLKQVTAKYHEQQKSFFENKFNYFRIVSNKYHYENFHSDVIAFLLNYKERHGQGALFINSFIGLLKSQNYIITGFNKTKIHRELGRIDILIRDEENRKSIIIENKINNAIDQENQLTRYYNYEDGQSYEAVAIIYLSLNGNKVPPHAETHIQNKVKQLAAYNTNDVDLYNDWLMQCLPKIADADVKSFVYQYAELYRVMSKQLIDYKIMKDFFNIISASQETYETAITTGRMINDLKPYLMKMLSEKYEPVSSSAFRTIEAYSEIEEDLYWVVMQDSFLSAQGFNLILELWIKEPNCIEVHLFSREPLLSENKLILNQIQTLKDFNMQYQDNIVSNHYGYFKEFSFPKQQGEIEQLVTGICKDINQLELNTKSI